MPKYKLWVIVESENEGNDTPYIKLAEMIDKSLDLGLIFEVEACDNK